MEISAERRLIKDQMPQTQLQLKHTENCRLLPDRDAMLLRMPKAKRVAEIGVAFGEFSQQILTISSPTKLTLIDSWSTDRYKAGLVKIQEAFLAQLRDGQLEVLQGRSTDVLRNQPPACFDWVYIDTNHSYHTTIEELRICDGLVAPGGRIAGHDFCTGNVINAIPYGVVEAVTQFCLEQDWQFEFLTVESRGHFSFCLKRL